MASRKLRVFMEFKDFLLRFFTWWNGATLNTLFYTRRFGELVGHDQFGNAYYRKPGKDPALGFERRWVLYMGVSEASATPPGWNAWLHHTTDIPPTADGYKPHPWEKPYAPNQTGTPFAYRPKGSVLNREPKRQANSGDYEAWIPEP